jgi:hypothetical protein
LPDQRQHGGGLHVRVHSRALLDNANRAQEVAVWALYGCVCRLRAGTRATGGSICGFSRVSLGMFESMRDH